MKFYGIWPIKMLSALIWASGDGDIVSGLWFHIQAHLNALFYLGQHMYFGTYRFGEPLLLAYTIYRSGYRDMSRLRLQVLRNICTCMIRSQPGPILSWRLIMKYLLRSFSSFR